jgi:predicted acyltransferase
MGEPERGRVVSVDVLRGLTVAFMIVANNPGDTMHVYQELVHAKWHGWTAVDFIFPLFLYLAGVSVALAAPSGPHAAPPPTLWPRAFARAGILFALGLVVNGFPYFDLESLRIPGVLQRISLVYLAALWLHLKLSGRGVAAVAAAILTGYWLLFAYVPVPGLGRPSLDFEHNLEGWLDQFLLRGHIWEYDTTWDPEGLLSTFPCVALALFGVLAGRWIREKKRLEPWRVFLIGLAMHCGGMLWNEWFPINKLITTSSFVLFVGGVGIMLTVVVHMLLDHHPPAAWLSPVLALGENALAVFVASQILTKVFYVTKLPESLGGMSLHFFFFEGLFGSIEDRYVASVAWAAALMAALALACMAFRSAGRAFKPRRMKESWRKGKVRP